MANGDGEGRISWDVLAKISQIAIYPLLLAMFYILMQMSGLDRRLAIIEVTTSRPTADVTTIAKLAVIEDRQSANTQQVKEFGNRIDKLSDLITAHMDASNGVVYRSPPRR